MKASLPLGKILGQIKLPPAMVSYAKTAGDEFWANQVADGFSDPVDVKNLPSGLDSDWVPFEALSKIGLKPRVEGDDVSAITVFTTGVDYHTDQPGPVLIWTLRNDRMWFAQRGVLGQIQPSAGDWFIFDGGKHHKMDLKGADAKKEGLVFIGVSLELDPIE